MDLLKGHIEAVAHPEIDWDELFHRYPYDLELKIEGMCWEPIFKIDIKVDSYGRCHREKGHEGIHIVYKYIKLGLGCPIYAVANVTLDELPHYLTPAERRALGCKRV